MWFSQGLNEGEEENFLLLLQFTKLIFKTKCCHKLLASLKLETLNVVVVVVDDDEYTPLVVHLEGSGNK